MAEEVLRIYEQGIKSGLATFSTQLPSWAQWDSGHLKHSRFVAMDDEKIIGWAALSPVSDRCVYAGVAEASIYIDFEYHGKGVGSALLDELINDSEKHGLWCLYAAILSENKSSLTLFRKKGFREIGYREKIAQVNNVWKDTILFEKRSRKIHWPV
ncbi:MAG TPA: GNAT family N-acetyltransferase [Chitinophagaceae bacterium]|nr:GNAT family N-acetyltransferase [Chitinophagaceae bacterium]